MDHYIELIRKRGMIPGLSTHMPETIPYADESDLDIGTYIQIYNAAHTPRCPTRDLLQCRELMTRSSQNKVGRGSA
jgi:hypothetical protein